MDGGVSITTDGMPTWTPPNMLVVADKIIVVLLADSAQGKHPTITVRKTWRFERSMWAFDLNRGTFTRRSHNGSQGFIVSIAGQEVMCPGCDRDSVYCGKDTDLICVRCEKVYVGRDIIGSSAEWYDRPLTAIEESFLDYISSLGVMVEEMLDQLPKSWTFDRG